MQDETGIIFLILLGVLLAVALGINIKWRVNEALTNFKSGSTLKAAKSKGKTRGNSSRTESYRNITDYLGDTVSVNGPRVSNYTPSYQSTEGMINLGSRGRVREPFGSGDVTTRLQELNGKKVNKKTKGALISRGPTSNVYGDDNGSGKREGATLLSKLRGTGEGDDSDDVGSGGCESTEFGCCPDGVTAMSDKDGSNCTQPIGGDCAGTQYGCCDDGTTAMSDKDGSNCPQPVGGDCAGTQYGCCDDGTTAMKDASGNNCPQPVGGNCAGTQYGCCDDGTTAMKDANGSNCPQPIGGCAGTQYGCCADGTTAMKNANGSNCPIGGCSGTQYGCCDDGTTAMTDANGSNCPAGGCAGTQYGCCDDGTTAKTDTNGSNCAQPAPAPQPQPSQPASQPAPYNTSGTVFIPPPAGGGGDSCKCPDPQPCPPPARCPEPAFQCEKVPNYGSSNSNYLPRPVLNDFSAFGM